jgi:DNA-binding response OmpR family regulator
VKILLVEDDEQLSGLLAQELTAQHYIIDTATDGQLGWELVESANYDLVVLDIGLPKLNGIEFCQRLRDRGHGMPVMMLTSQDSDADKVKGLDAGADDYVVKTVGRQEFAARVRALLRRTSAAVAMVLEWGNLQLDLASCRVSYSDRPLTLTAKEYALLELLMRNPERVFSLSTILHQLWTFDDELPGEDTIRAHVKRLRQKLKAVGADDLVETVYGMGYRLNPAFHQQSQKPSSPAQPSHPASPLSAQDWQFQQQELLTRIKTIQTIIETLSEQRSNKLVQQQAARECHKLIGTLGALELQEAVQISRSLESCLAANTQLDSQQLQQAQEEAIALQNIVAAADMANVVRVAQAIDNQHLQGGTGSKSPDNPPKVLILDDDPLMLRLLTAILQPWGLNVTTLKHPSGFWQELERLSPELLILDVQLPEVDGIELCTMIRNQPRWAWLPIVFLTGHRDSETVQQLFAAGADDYVSKPVIAPELITRVLNRIERTQLLRNQTANHPANQAANHQESRSR